MRTRVRTYVGTGKKKTRKNLSVDNSRQFDLWIEISSLIPPAAGFNLDFIVSFFSY